MTVEPAGSSATVVDGHEERGLGSPPPALFRRSRRKNKKKKGKRVKYLKNPLVVPQSISTAHNTPPDIYRAARVLRIQHRQKSVPFLPLAGTLGKNQPGQAGFTAVPIPAARLARPPMDATPKTSSPLGLAPLRPTPLASDPRATRESWQGRPIVSRITRRGRRRARKGRLRGSREP